MKGKPVGQQNINKVNKVIGEVVKKLDVANDYSVNSEVVQDELAKQGIHILLSQASMIIKQARK